MKCPALLISFLVGLWGLPPTMRADSLPPTPGVRKSVNLPPGATINGINDLGQLVGTITDSNGVHGFLDSQGVFTQFDVPGSSATQAVGINDAGQIVGFNTMSSGGSFHFQAFLETNGVFTDLAASGVQSGFAMQSGIAINNSGSVVYTTAGFIDFSVLSHLNHNGTEIFFSFIPAPPDDAANVYATGINDSGAAVGYFTAGIEHEGFRDGGSLICQAGSDLVNCYSFAFPGEPTGINDAGDIIGITGDQSGFLSRNGNFTALDFSPTGINNRGQIVGGGDFIFNITPAPEPSTVLLFGCGLAAVGIAMKGRRRSSAR